MKAGKRHGDKNFVPLSNFHIFLQKSIVYGIAGYLTGFTIFQTA